MKKGFTLVELLAVIVILSIIAIITIPMISNVIEKSKLGAMEDSAYGLIEAANYYYAEHMNEMSSNKLFVIENGAQTSEEKLNYKGKIEGNAKVLLASNGKVALCLTNGKSYAKKEITDTKVVMNTVSSDTTCEINGLESDSDITIDISGGNSSYYDKVEIDDKLNDIRNDLSDLSSIVSSNKAAIDNLNSSLANSGSFKYNEETDSLDIYQDGIVIGSLFCGFQFDGFYLKNGAVNNIGKITNTLLSYNLSNEYLVVTSPKAITESGSAYVDIPVKNLRRYSNISITAYSQHSNANVHMNANLRYINSSGSVTAKAFTFSGGYYSAIPTSEATVKLGLSDLTESERDTAYIRISAYNNKYSDYSSNTYIKIIYAYNE